MIILTTPHHDYHHALKLTCQSHPGGEVVSVVITFCLPSSHHCLLTHSSRTVRSSRVVCELECVLSYMYVAATLIIWAAFERGELMDAKDLPRSPQCSTKCGFMCVSG